jgi:TPR repeat protein
VYAVSIDLIEASRYYKLPADQRNSIAQCRCAICRKDWNGVAIDLIEAAKTFAAKYCRLAADQGTVYAQLNYAFFL